MSILDRKYPLPSCSDMVTTFIHLGFQLESQMSKWVELKCAHVKLIFTDTHIGVEEDGETTAHFKHDKLCASDVMLILHNLKVLDISNLKILSNE